MKKILKFLLHRMVLVGMSLLFQIFLLMYIVWNFNQYFIFFYSASVLVAILMVLYIVNSKTNPSYKIAWIIPLLLFPVFGCLFYLIFGGKKLSKKQKSKLKNINFELNTSLYQDKKTLDKVKLENNFLYNHAFYLEKNAKCPIYDNTYTTYLNTGTIYYEKLIEELKRAKKYIFLEYFIISKGKMWDSILEILKQKVNSGVEVRVIYDDMGCIMTLPSHYYKYLQSIGIKCCNFNPFIPVLSSRINNRDHRKIVIIDGLVGFTGGINIADEYINQKQKFGYWKDNGIMLKGNAVWSLTVMFLTTWNFTKGTIENYENFKQKNNQNKVKGFVQCYADSPLDDEATGETVYLNMINSARKTIYITTPYLIIDNEMITALSIASKSGVDIRIIVPGIPDKKIVNEVTKGYYESLIENGIKIYEYEKGFIHAKTCIVDSIIATIGTINFDYRSLYLHFECGVYLYKTDSINDIIKDFDNILKESKEITLENVKKVSSVRKLCRAVLRIFSPMM